MNELDNAGVTEASYDMLTAAQKVYVQDYSETYKEGDLDIKIAAMKRLLNYGATHKNKTKASLVWYFNFASAYSKVISLFGYEISTSDGYRDNATHTHAAMLDFLSSTEYFGPTGVVLMDYAGVSTEVSSAVFDNVINTKDLQVNDILKEL